VLRRSAPRFRAAAVPGTGGEGSPAGGVGLAFGGGMAPGRDRGGDGGAPAARAQVAVAARAAWCRGGGRRRVQRVCRGVRTPGWPPFHRGRGDAGCPAMAGAWA